MRKYADPEHCPDCGGSITVLATVCPDCHLVLAGPLGTRLFHTLSLADQILAQMRAASFSAAQAGFESTHAPAAVAVAPAAMPLRRYPTAAPTPPPTGGQGLAASSVPKILLGLGAACLLVAAIVFLAVTWSLMGVGGRTATLLAFTAGTAALTWWLAGRDLRGATEALGLVTLGLVSLDLVGADNAGWFGDISGPTLTVVIGAVLAAVSLAATDALRRLRGCAFTAGEVTTGFGALLMAAGLTLGEDAPGLRLVAAVLAAATVTALAVLLDHDVARLASAAVTGLAWAGLALYGLGEALDEPLNYATIWGDVQGWPLGAAAVLVSAVAAIPTLPMPARVGALGTGLLLGTVLVVAPVFDEQQTVAALAVVACLAIAAAAAPALGRPWGTAALVPGAAAALAVTGYAAQLSILSISRLTEVAAAAWDGTPGGRLPGAETGHLIPAGWVLPVAVLALLGATYAVVRLLGAQVSRDARIAAAALAGASVFGMLSLYAVPVWFLLAVILLASAALVTYGLWRDAAVATTAGGVVLVGALTLSLYDEWLTLAALATTLLLTAATHVRARRALLVDGAGAMFALALAGSAWTAGTLADADLSWAALTGMVLLGVLALARGRSDSEGTEIGAAAAAIPLAVAGVAEATPALEADWTAVYLTVAGVSASLIALVRSDRREVGWAGGVLLAMATWVRLWDRGIETPEAYTLPSAIALLVVGTVHLRRHPGSQTHRALGPGLGLALLPSLLWVLDDPGTMRSVLLGLACLGLVAWGVTVRWAAPLTYGSAVGLLVVLRHAAPVIDATVHPWVLIGSAGALLIAMGVTWEERLREARVVRVYVQGLR